MRFKTLSLFSIRNDTIMKERLEEQRNNFLLDVWAAIKKNQVVVIILHSSEIGHYYITRNDNVTDIDDMLKSLCEIPFLGRISPENAFGEWEDYFDDVTLAEIYGFELEGDMAQITILDKYITPPEKTEIHEAYCNEKLSERLFNDGYHGDMVDNDSISLACAMCWLREVKGVNINIRMTFYEHIYAQVPKVQYMTDIYDMSTDQWYDNDIWEETYEKCAEAAINFYYDNIL